MNDKREMMLATMLMLDQLAEQFDSLSHIYRDFAELANTIRSYRDDFARHAKITTNEFDSYKNMVLGEVNEPPSLDDLNNVLDRE